MALLSARSVLIYTQKPKRIHIQTYTRVAVIIAARADVRWSVSTQPLNLSAAVGLLQYAMTDGIQVLSNT